MKTNVSTNKDELLRQLERVPNELKERNQWMPYKLTPRPNGGKMNKIPQYNGHAADKTNSNHWLSYQECIEQLEDDRYGYDGIGFCPSKSNLLFIDLDNCFDAYGKLDSRARDIVNGIDGYAERSQSGEGLHIVTLTNKYFGNPKSEDGKVEIFTDRMYLAMTGDVFEDRTQVPVFEVDTTVLEGYLTRAVDTKPFDAFEAHSRRDPTLTLEKAEDILMNQIIPNPNRGDWLQIGMGLHFQFEADIDALIVWDKYSAREEAGNYQGFSDLEKTWNGFKLNHPNPITFATIYQKLKKPELSEEEVLEESQPIRYDLDKPKPVRYLLNGFMSEGITSIAGASGAGKTTMVVELASIVAHLFDETKAGIDKHFLKVRGRRKVIHFTEHAEQIERTLYGKRRFGQEYSSINCSTAEANDWYIVVPTKKYSAAQLAKLVLAYSKKHTVSWPTGRLDKEGQEIIVVMAPLLIFDTASASFALEDENSNSEQSKMIAAIKEVVRDLHSSIWIITHVAKAAKELDLKRQSSRGAGAIEADVQTAASLGREIGAECSVLSITKNRIQTKFDEINFKPSFHTLMVEDEWGDWQNVEYITGELIQSTSQERIQNKKESKQKTAKEAKQFEIKERAAAIMELLNNSTNQKLYNQGDIQDALAGNSGVNRAAVTLLIEKGYLVNKKLDKAQSAANEAKRKALIRTAKYFDVIDLRDANE